MSQKSRNLFYVLLEQQFHNDFMNEEITLGI